MCNGVTNPPKVGRPSIINRMLKTFASSFTLANEYHVNPHVIGKTPEEAKGQVVCTVSDEDGARLRAAGSKCMAAWMQAGAYPRLPEWLISKGRDVPASVVSWLRFLGDGSDGLHGYCRFLKNSPAPASPAVAATPPGTTVPEPCICGCTDGTHACAADYSLIKQRLETVLAANAGMEKAMALNRREIARATAVALKLKEKNHEKHRTLIRNQQYLRRSNTLMKNNSKAWTAEKKKLTKSLKRKSEIIERESPQQRPRKDVSDLVPKGRAFRERVKASKRVLAPRSVGIIQKNNKQLSQRKR